LSPTAVPAIALPRSPAPPWAAGTGVADGERVRATGVGLGPLVWRGLFLTIVTLGIYRFWYRTDLRRWYWRNTVVGGDGFAYLGTPRELFVGFLIALAVTLPLYFAGALAALLLASEALANAVTALGLLALAVLAQYGAWRSRRYRMTRTAWRGVRFDQTGSAWRYAFVSIAWALAALATLGLLLPVFRRALEGMKIGRTRFGSAEGRFSAPLGGLMLRWLPLWLILIVLAAGALHSLGAASVEEEGTREQVLLAAAGVLAILAGILAFGLLWPAYRAAEFRIFTAGTAIGPVSFRSDLAAAALYGMYLKFGLVLGASLVGAAALALGLLGVAAATLRIEALGASRGWPVIAAAAFAYLGGVYVVMALKELMLNRAFWRRAAGSVTVFGLERVGGITAVAVADEAATGEGIGDAIDFGGV
jgi:uncharacterized membrane protein YjgN (DUF898 family)